MKVLGQLEGAQLEQVAAATTTPTSRGRMYMDTSAATGVPRLYDGSTWRPLLLGISGSKNSAYVNIVAKTANYTVTVDDDVLLGSTAAFSFTLPLASSAPGKRYVFKKTDAPLANILTVARAGADTIDGATSTTLNTLNETLTIVSDGVSAWYVLARSYPTQLTGLVLTPNNFGTTVNPTWQMYRHGKMLRIRGSFLTGVRAAAIASLSLPANITIDTTGLFGSQYDPMGDYYAGTAAANINVYAASTSGAAFYDGADATKIFLALQVGLGFAKGNANALANADGGYVSVDLVIPVSGWHE